MQQLTAYIKAIIDNHGGDLAWASQKFGIPIDKWLDLSTGINPYSYPVLQIQKDDWHFLPTRVQLEGVIDAARIYYCVPDKTKIIIGPGSQMLVNCLALILPEPKKIAIIYPTYEGHAQAFLNAGFQLTKCHNLHEIADSPCTYAVVVNPNNPDGRVHHSSDLLKLANLLHQRGGALIVDEAFADTTPQISLAPSATEQGLIVIRSVGKFFGLAGLRVGFMLGCHPILDQLRLIMHPWPIGNYILKTVQSFLLDHAWQNRMRQQLTIEAISMDNFLLELGLHPVRGVALFCLIEQDDALSIYRKLANCGIYVRAFSTYPRWLRLGLLTSENYERFRKAFTS
jgi:cobalamin biosynthetic protein CobC